MDCKINILDSIDRSARINYSVKNCRLQYHFDIVLGNDTDFKLRKLATVALVFVDVTLVLSLKQEPQYSNAYDGEYRECDQYVLPVG